MSKLSFWDLCALLPWLIFLILTLPYFGQAPAMDPMINYRHSTAFFHEGFTGIVNEGVTAHPPLLYSLSTLAFYLFGKSPLSVNMLGALIFLASSLILYFTLKGVFNQRMAFASTLLLFINPLVVVNFYYLTSEALMIMGTILAFMTYIKSRWVLLTIALTLLSLMKETALTIIGGVFLTFIADLIIFRNTLSVKLNQRLPILAVFLPALIVTLAWAYYLSTIGTTEWRDTTFVKDNQGSYQIVLQNLLGLKIFNQFLIGNIVNAFINNFQWVFLVLISPILLLIKYGNPLPKIEQKKAALFFALVGITYIILTLSFPTWTIPRYSIPALLSFFFFFALLLIQITKPILYWAALIFLSAILLMANFVSIDPLTANSKNIKIYGTSLYDQPFWNNSPDRLMYNLQFLQAVSNQNKFIKNAVDSNADIIVAQCDELKLGEKLWTISINPTFYPQFKGFKNTICLKEDELEEQLPLGLLDGKIIYWVPKNDPTAPTGVI